MHWRILFLLVLVSCAPIAQEVVTKPVMDDQIQPPRAEPVVLEPEVKAPQEIIVEEPVQPEAPSEPELTGKDKCLSDCENSCSENAILSCRQKERSKCKANCGDIIDPSACTQACTYISQPQHCKTQFEQFCGVQCIKLCV